MSINRDFTKRACINSEKELWHKSPADGVERLYLERDDAGESAVATTIVKFAPGSKFEQHTHDGGEEFLVLDGVFSDEFGSYSKGTYIRNPKGSAHNPYSESGCILFVTPINEPTIDNFCSLVKPLKGLNITLRNLFLGGLSRSDMLTP